MCGRRVLLPTATNGRCIANREQPSVGDKIREEREELRESSNIQRGADQQSA